ncbi:MAG: hypothetical protein WCF72_12745 [Pseudolabrys sp.]
MTQSEQYWTSVQSPERLARVQFLELPVKSFMHPKLIIATAVPLGFFSLRTHQVTKADAQKVVEIISGDKAKTQSYCDMTKLDEQIKQAKEKKDSKTVNELSQKLDLLEERLGPEYVALIDGLEDIDPKSDVAQQIESILDDLYDNLCGG